MTDSPDREPRHPIRVVARRAGVSLHLVRAWERRYGVVSPARSDGGQRLYSDADVERLRLLREAVDAGRSISQVAELPTEELAALVATDRAPAARDLLALRLDECLSAAERFDERALDLALIQGLAAVSPIEFTERLVAPLLHEVGERWHTGGLAPAHEQAVSAALRRSLTFLLGAFRAAPGAPTLVAATLAGEGHEFGALLASARAAEAGWRVLYVGPGRTAADLARLSAVNHASAVAVSLVNELDAEPLVARLLELRAALPGRVLLLAGGRAADRHAATLAQLPGIETSALRTLPALLTTAGLEQLR